ncbi:MAG: DNA recombination/repair protein RecA [Chloroflexi bacterium]|nr:DNA recombination/repair protein RecA [Chloroflexota bacterium]
MGLSCLLRSYSAKRTRGLLLSYHKKGYHVVASFVDRSILLDQLILSAEQRWGYKALVRLSPSSTVSCVPVIPTGFSSFDSVLGIGGIPRGRISEIFGARSSGKTTLVMKLIAMGQLNGGVAAYIDLLHTFDPVYATQLGIDLGHLLVARPNNLAEALRIATSLSCSKDVALIIFDYTTSSSGNSKEENAHLPKVPDSPIKGSQPHQEIRSHLMSTGLRNLLSLIDKSGAALVFINDLCSINGKEESTGGLAMKFYSSVRVNVSRKDWIRCRADIAGWVARVTVVKNKLAPPFGATELEIIHENRLRAA